MSDAEDVHPNLRPDPARVQRWRDDVEHLRGEIMTLVMFRDDFAKFEKIVRGNASIMQAASPFPARVKQWYIDSQIMRILTRPPGTRGLDANVIIRSSPKVGMG